MEGLNTLWIPGTDHAACRGQGTIIREHCGDCAGLCCHMLDINAITRPDVQRLGEAIGAETAEALVSWAADGELGNMIMRTAFNPVTREMGLVCPLHVDGSCSVYEHRPETCRKFEVGEPCCEKLKEWR